MPTFIEFVPRGKKKNCCSCVTELSDTRVHTTEAITDSGYTVLLHPHCSLDLASSDYHLFGPLTKINLWRHHYAGDKALQNVMHQWLQGRESSCCWMGIHAFVQRWKKNLSSDRDHIGKHLCLQQCSIDILWENFEMPDLQIAWNKK